MSPTQLPREVLHKILGIAVENEVVKVDCIFQGKDIACINLRYSDTLKALLDVEEIKEDARLMSCKKATLDLTETYLNRLQHFQDLKEQVHCFQNIRVTLLPSTCLKKEIGGLFDKVERLSLVARFNYTSGVVNYGSTAEKIGRAMKSFFPLVEGATVKVLMVGKKLDQAVDDELYASFRLLPDSDKDKKAFVFAKQMYAIPDTKSGFNSIPRQYDFDVTFIRHGLGPISAKHGFSHLSSQASSRVPREDSSVGDRRSNYRGSFRRKEQYDCVQSHLQSYSEGNHGRRWDESPSTAPHSDQVGVGLHRSRFRCKEVWNQATGWKCLEEMLRSFRRITLPLPLLDQNMEELLDGINDLSSRPIPPTTFALTAVWTYTPLDPPVDRLLIQDPPADSPLDLVSISTSTFTERLEARRLRSAMSSPQRRRELPQEIRDKILSYLLVDEVVKVRTVKTRVYLTTEEIEARIRARRHPDSMQDSLRHLNCYKMRIHRELSQVDLVYSDSLWILMGEGLRKDEIQDLVYKNATRDLTRINLRRVLNCQEILKPLLHKFRKIQLSLNFPNEKLGRVFDQIEHLTIKGSIWESYRNVMGSKTRTREDDLSVIPARAIKGLFSLTKGAAVEPVKVLRGCKPDDLGSLPMRILPDEGKDKDAAAHGKKHGMCGLE